MSGDGVARPVLAAIAVGSDLAQALRVGAAAEGPEGRRWARAQAALTEGASETDALRQAGLPTSAAFDILVDASPEDRPEVAQRLFDALAGPTTTDAALDGDSDPQPSLGWLSRRGAASVYAMVLAVVGWGVAAVLFTFTLPDLAPSSAGSLRAEVTVAVVLLGIGFVAAGAQLGRERFRRPGDPLRWLRFVSAGLAAGAEPGRTLARLQVDGGPGLDPWVRATAELPSAEAARRLAQDDLLPEPIAQVAARPLAGETPAAAWARAATAWRRERMREAQLPWPLYLGLAAIGLGGGLLVVATYAHLALIGGPWP